MPLCERCVEDQMIFSGGPWQSTTTWPSGWRRNHPTKMCYKLNVCPSIHTLTSNPQCDGVRRGGLWEVMKSWRWSPMMGLVSLLKYTFLFLYSPPCEDTARQHHQWNRKCGPHQTLNLIVPSSWTSCLQTVESKWCSVRAAQWTHCGSDSENKIGRECRGPGI